jgi:hypothetical protein
VLNLGSKVSVSALLDTTYADGDLLDTTGVKTGLVNAVDNHCARMKSDKLDPKTGTDREVDALLRRSEGLLEVRI